VWVPVVGDGWAAARGRPADEVSLSVPVAGQPHGRAREEVLTFHTRGRPPWAEHGVNPAAPAGVSARTILETGVLTLPGTLETLQVTAHLDTVRVTARLPLRMMVIDRRLAYLDLDPDQDRPALVVHAPPLVAALVDYFEHAWRDAVPATAADTATSPAGPGPSPAQRRVLLLLATGATDEAIARQLGMSPRSVRRHIAALLDQAGTTSRFACAITAIRHGWLTIPGQVRPDDRRSVPAPAGGRPT
jgi:DNA-binding CsgD family transcriptional regulator